MSIAEKALEHHLAEDDSSNAASTEGEDDDEGTASASPSREALREAYDAMKRSDFDGFADAVEALVDIKLASR